MQCGALAHHITRGGMWYAHAVRPLRVSLRMPSWIVLYTIAPTFTVVVVRDNTCDVRMHHIASVRRAALYFRETFVSPFGRELRYVHLGLQRKGRAIHLGPLARIFAHGVTLRPPR